MDCNAEHFLIGNLAFHATEGFIVYDDGTKDEATELELCEPASAALIIHARTFGG